MKTLDFYWVAGHEVNLTEHVQWKNAGKDHKKVCVQDKKMEINVCTFIPQAFSLVYLLYY